ncbi:APC family permease [Agaribacterium haliotis]|uniref:APC family permease n=1 Tax=Agaribacterium haliotis TaxID=2013869 RepID=UPI000BB52DC4|nr:APC family permease [Agaribacterium haliotis]
MSANSEIKHQKDDASPSAKTVGTLGAMSIGIGGMVGGGIFAVLGLAASMGGGATPLAFLIAGCVALLSAYSYAKLSVALPSRGGTVIFIDRAFGVAWFSGTINNLLWISYVVTLALYSVAFANYALTFFPDINGNDKSLFLHGLISLAIVVPTLLNLFSAELISKTETAAVVFKLAILALIIVVGISGVDSSRFAASEWKTFPQIVAAGMIIFVAYEGFELIANAAEDVRDYKKTLPKAFYGSVVLVILLYVLIAIVTVGTLSAADIQKYADFALAVAAEPSLGHAGFVLVAVSAVLATFSAINATLYGAARLSYVIATEGELPVFLERKVWKQPVMGLLITAVLALILANAFDLSSIATMGSAGFLLIFAAVNAANFCLAKQVNSNRALACLGVAACLIALGVLIWQSLQTQPWQLMTLVVMLLAAGLIEALYRLSGKTHHYRAKFHSRHKLKASHAAKTRETKADGDSG